MKKFVVLYHAPKSAMETMEGNSKEEGEKGMEEWQKWAASCGECLTDMGTPLGNAHHVTPEGASASDTTVVGYSMMEAKDLDHASELLKDHPHLKWTEGCSIEVHESLPLPGM